MGFDFGHCGFIVAQLAAWPCALDGLMPDTTEKEVTASDGGARQVLGKMSIPLVMSGTQ
jgi:hypothetical protein